MLTLSAYARHNETGCAGQVVKTTGAKALHFRPVKATRGKRNEASPTETCYLNRSRDRMRDKRKKITGV